MASESFRISTVMAGLPTQLYAAWLDARRHTEMTGATAEIERGVGGRFTAWDGYIRGTTIELEPERRIVQRWRTSEFPDDAPDSRLEVLFSPEAGGTRVSLAHSGLPVGQGDLYRSGWDEFYFQPMKRWCAAHADAESLAALGADIDNAAADPRFLELVGPGVHAARSPATREGSTKRTATTKGRGAAAKRKAATKVPKATPKGRTGAKGRKATTKVPTGAKGRKVAADLRAGTKTEAGVTRGAAAKPVAVKRGTTGRAKRKPDKA